MGGGRGGIILSSVYGIVTVFSIIFPPCRFYFSCWNCDRLSCLSLRSLIMGLLWKWAVGGVDVSSFCPPTCRARFEPLLIAGVARPVCWDPRTFPKSLIPVFLLATI